MSDTSADGTDRPTCAETGCTDEATHVEEAGNVRPNGPEVAYCEDHASGRADRL